MRFNTISAATLGAGLLLAGAAMAQTQPSDQKMAPKQHNEQSASKQHTQGSDGGFNTGPASGATTGPGAAATKQHTQGEGPSDAGMNTGPGSRAMTR